MSSQGKDDLGTFARWAQGFSPESLERALADQRILRKGQLNDGDVFTRTTPAGLTESHYQTLRGGRDDLDFREWNTESAFSGVDRWPNAPGAQSEGQKRRRARREQMDDGF